MKILWRVIELFLLMHCIPAGPWCCSVQRSKHCVHRQLDPISSVLCCEGRHFNLWGESTFEIIRGYPQWLVAMTSRVSSILESIGIIKSILSLLHRDSNSGALDCPRVSPSSGSHVQLSLLIRAIIWTLLFSCSYAVTDSIEPGLF